MSRLKSTAGAKAAKAAKPARGAARGGAANAPRGVYVQKPKSDIYVAMLGIALGAILLGCLLLLWVWYGYGWQTKPTVLGPIPSHNARYATLLENSPIPTTVRL